MVREQVVQWRHYFNDILYSRLPFSIRRVLSISIALFMLHLKNAMGVINETNELVFTMYSITGGLVLFALVILCWWIFCWFNDVLIESVIDSRYVRKLRAALVCGFFPFPLSETMLFGGFFWAYFDRVYNPGYAVSICLPSGMEEIDYARWPLLGTIVLITSGYYANHTYYLARAGIYNEFWVYSCVTIVLAFSFLSIQLIEYNGLSFTISDNVYGSFFYLPTGFHGFHVTVGLLFLCEQYGRLSTDETEPDVRRFFVRDFIMGFNRDRNLGLAFSLIYWHFVDIIWIFLYVNVYVYNTGHGYELFNMGSGDAFYSNSWYNHLMYCHYMIIHNMIEFFDILTA